MHQEASQPRRNADGVNVSYDNSFRAIKTNIFQFKTQTHDISLEEKPNKPRDTTNDRNMTMEVQLNNLTVAAQDPLNNTTKAVT